MAVAAVAALALLQGTPSVERARAGADPSHVIKHVVVIFQENHTFDNMLGRYCKRNPERGCDGAVTGRLSNGNRIRLKQAKDIVPLVRHRPKEQLAAINDGKMNGFNKMFGCGERYNYRCYSQFREWQIPSFSKLARQYVISDRTFSLSPVTSWGAHMQLASADQGVAHFVGNNPHPGGRENVGPGWGCDSLNVAQWQSPITKDVSLEPSCIPKPNGDGPFRNSPVPTRDTIFQDFQAKGLRWKIYAPLPRLQEPYQRGYAWAICPTFATCLKSKQHNHMVSWKKIIDNGKAGTLPNVSYVVPWVPNSQHNGDSMMKGDNWIAKVVNAIGNGPDWRSTAIFLTYDDCGCFYDHIPPPQGSGWSIRLPMVIISPYAKSSFTDSTPATFASIVKYIQNRWDLPTLGRADQDAYDYSNSFNYDRTPRRFQRLELHPVSEASLEHIASHPVVMRD